MRHRNQQATQQGERQQKRQEELAAAAVMAGQESAATAAMLSAPHDPLAGIDKYRCVAEINHGTFGMVLLAQNTGTGEQVALKLIERGPQLASVKYVEREVTNHMKLRHPHVIDLREVGRRTR